MTVASKVGGTVVAAAILVVAVQVLKTPDGGRTPRTPTPREMPVVLVATAQTNRDFSITWSANGQRHDEGIIRIFPWERAITARAGTVVTFTLAPRRGGDGAHTCTIEHPPGRPLPGNGQKVGHGTTAIMCSATIGA